ncbi:MAG: isoprenylcysteine carboxylmethyltransferase family protein [Acidobacteria bacterium]|jgi:protein-S-isoprenylcysteine O-methyltransferase Ste14|nr:isoprenylcysteine carboxylmethyltransferase family protein [Acidobacteriota bacterium]
MAENYSLFRPSFFLQAGAVLFLVALTVLHPGPWNLARWVGLALALPSAILLILARYQLGAAFSVAPKARMLVTHGIYSRIRNPIYLFSGLAVLGLVISLQVLPAYLIPALLIVVQTIRARQEAKVLEARFGDAYREYRAHTWF